MKLISQYFDQNMKPRLMPSFCALVDILGFKEICSEAFEQDQGDVILNKIHKILSSQSKQLTPKPERKHSLKWWDKFIEENVVIGKESFRRMITEPKPKREPYKPSWHVTFFTDNVVIGHIIDSPDGESEIGWVILQIMLHQLLLADEGLFVRGGISIGKLFIDNNVVFGPALVDAYNLEKDANHPRIILSDNVLSLMEKYLEYYGEPYDSPENNHILIDLDDKPFINYLALLFDEAQDPNVPWQYLKRHKQNIERCLNKFKNDPHITQKYNWLANYHNFICSEYNDFPGYSEDFIIRGSFNIANPHRIIKERTRKPVRLD